MLKKYSKKEEKIEVLLLNNKKKGTEKTEKMQEGGETEIMIPQLNPQPQAGQT